MNLNNILILSSCCIENTQHLNYKTKQSTLLRFSRLLFDSHEAYKYTVWKNVQFFNVKICDSYISHGAF
jgi:hypothetical protein